MRYVQPEETGEVRPQQKRGVQGPAGGGTRGSGAGGQAAGSHRCLHAAEIEQGTYIFTVLPSYSPISLAQFLRVSCRVSFFRPFIR